MRTCDWLCEAGDEVKWLQTQLKKKSQISHIKHPSIDVPPTVSQCWIEAGAPPAGRQMIIQLQTYIKSLKSHHFYMKPQSPSGKAAQSLLRSSSSCVEVITDIPKGTQGCCFSLVSYYLLLELRWPAQENPLRLRQTRLTKLESHGFFNCLLIVCWEWNADRFIHLGLSSTWN